MTMKGVDIEREKKAFASFRFRPKGMVYMNSKFLCLKLKIFSGRRSKTDWQSFTNTGKDKVFGGTLSLRGAGTHNEMPSRSKLESLDNYRG